MIIHKSYKFLLKPSDVQLQSLLQHGGNTRSLWNHFLNLNQEQYKLNQTFIFSHELTTSIPKLKEEKTYLSLSFSQSLQTVARQLDRALKDSFKSNAERKGFPKFKSKSNHSDSFTIPQKFRVEKDYVFLPKIGNVKWIKHRPIKGKVKHLVISQSGEQWFCSVCCELKVKSKPIVINENEMVGVDLGIKTYAMVSDGTKIENPKILRKLEQKVIREQRRMDRKKKGSKSRNKQRIKLARVHKHIRNKRKDFLHKTSHDMTTKYQGICLETLNVKGMVRNHCLAKSISDASWGEFVRQLEYKHKWASKPFVQIDRWEASSKTCSCCAWIDHELELSDRMFICQNCHMEMDRDLNAAINIKAFGLRDMRNKQNDATVAKVIGKRSVRSKDTVRHTVGMECPKQVSSLPQEEEMKRTLGSWRHTGLFVSLNLEEELPGLDSNEVC